VILNLFLTAFLVLLREIAFGIRRERYGPPLESQILFGICSTAAKAANPKSPAPKNFNLQIQAR